MPTARYQHGAVFVNARLHISGGAVGGGRMVDDAAPVVVLDTAAGVWCTQAPAAGPSDNGADSHEWARRCAAGLAARARCCTQVACAQAWLCLRPGQRRCRHAVAAVGPYVFVYGGLRGSALLDDFLLADDSSGAELSVCDPRSQAWCAHSRA